MWINLLSFMLLLKKLFYFAVSIVIILLLALSISSNQINTSFIGLEINIKSATVQSLTHASTHVLNDISVINIIDSALSVGAITGVNQAANFNHSVQLLIEYLFIALLTLFIVVVNYRHFKLAIALPPWYLLLKHHLRLSISGWKITNLQYQFKLTYPH